MYQRATVTMSMRELDRLKVIQAVVDGELRAGLTAERLGRSARQGGLVIEVAQRPGRRCLVIPSHGRVGGV